MTDKIEKMTDDDFKKIMQQLGMPESKSLYSALKQVENHTWQAAQSVPVVRCKCCGYLVTESEHKGCLRAADATVPEGFVMVPVVPTAAELDEKDARIRDLEAANASLEASYRGSCMMYDATKVELDALRRCKELLAEARDDVSEQLNHMLPLAGYPSNDKRISKQRELLAAIDAAIAQGKGE